MKRLVIIDGKSVFYRGYFAMGNLATTEGVPTSGIYGFATIAMEVVKKIEPDKVIVAWDKAHTSTSKRLVIYKDYKAGRTKPPEDFYAQIPMLKELIVALGWGFLEADGYEADDIIGTLAKQADDKSDCLTYIISSDLDMLQIVDKNTKMYRLMKGFSDIEEIDVSAVEEKYGILKDQFLDLKALKGDASDNIPGVAGIGEKTAVKLLNQYKSLQGVYENLPKISSTVREKLEKGRTSAEMSYALAKIMTDAPVDLDEIPDLVIDGKRILEALKKLEFYSLIKKFKKEIGNIDVAFGDKNKRSEKETIQNFKIEDNLLVVSDIKSKMHQSKQLEDEILKEGKKIWDLDQADFLLNPLRRDEKRVEQTELEFDDVVSRIIKGEYTNEEKLRFLKQKEQLQKMPKLIRILNEFDLPLIPVLFKMEERGILINLEYFEKLRKEFTERVYEYEQKIYTMAGAVFNVNSPVQLSKILFEKLELPTKGIKKTTRGYSTGANELEKMRGEHPIIELIMEYREASKLLSTYILPLPMMKGEDGRIHTTFTQNVTATGRLSSLNPNLQNIPVRSEDGKRIRTGFIAEQGKVLVSADYAQFELRLAAVLASDFKLIDDFNNGIDVHTKTAAEVFNVPMEKVTKQQRRAAKVINFGVMYGISPKGLSEAAGMSFSEAKEFINNYFKVRQPIKEYLDKQIRQAQEEGYVETFFGRRRPTPDVKSANFIIRSSAERAAQNMPIQGTEADLMKRVMIKVDKEMESLFGERARLILQIHDSLIVECEEEIQDEVSRKVMSIMEGIAPELKICLKVDVSIGKNWGEI